MSYEDLLEVIDKHGHSKFWDTLRKLIENKIKYRWHDLRKNPNDLPEYYKRVEVISWDRETHELNESNFTHYGVSSPFSGNPMNIWQQPYEYAYYGSDVILWREIEPYEEVA